MRTRQLGNSNLQLTTIGLGTWAIAGGAWSFGWGSQDEGDAVAAIVRAVQLGINWIDTAAVYGGGQSERLVGRALQRIDAAERPLIATKCGRILQQDGSIRGIIKKQSVIDECEASLQRLGVDTIDLYQLHWPDPDEDIEEAWAAMDELLQQGKVRCIGVSNHSTQQMDRLQPIAPIASLQPPYNMINRDAEQELLPYCESHKIGVVCYSPMGKGLLTGAFSAERAAQLGDDDHRSRDPKFKEPQLSINLQFVEQLRSVADSRRITLAQLAIAWVLRRQEVTAAIVGARRPDQIESTVAAGEVDLTSDEIQRIERLLSERDQALESQGVIDTGRV